MSKLFKSYKTMDEYNKDKISISKDNLSYVYSGSEFMIAEKDDSVVTYNTICFIEDGSYIYRNNKRYTGGDSGTVYPDADETHDGLMTSDHVKDLLKLKVDVANINTDNFVSKNSNGTVSITTDDITAIYGGNHIKTANNTITIDDLVKSYNKTSYDNSTKHINFYHDDSLLGYIDCTDFIISGFVKSVTTTDTSFIFTFETSNGDEEYPVLFSKIFQASDYYKANAIDELLKEKQDTLVSEDNIKSLTCQGTSYSLVGSGTVALPEVYHLKVHLYSSSNSYYSVECDFFTNIKYEGTSISDFTSWLSSQGYNSSSNVYPCSGIGGSQSIGSIFSSSKVPYFVKWLYTSSDGKTLYGMKENNETCDLSTNTNKINVIQTRIM